MNTGGELIQSLKEEIRKGIALIEHLDDEAYTAKPESPASVGSHFRHNLDFGTNLIRGLEKGELDYSKRDRDIEVETNRDYAIDRFNSLLLSLSAITESDLKKPITVRSEVDDSLWVESSLLRELEFIHSHTVHHYALIAAKLSSMGIELSVEFGVAPSTLKYWNSGKKDSANA